MAKPRLSLSEAHSLTGLLVTAVATGIVLAACGGGQPYQVPPVALLPTPTPTYPVTTGASYLASPSPTPPRPTPPATGSILIDTLGAGQLVAPRGVAFAGGSLFVADQDHQGLLGTYGSVLRFDPDHGQRQGVYFSRSATESLPADLTGVAVATVSVGSGETASLLYPISPWAVFGFGASTEFPLNFGNPLTLGGQDIAIAGDVAWVAEARTVRAFHLPDWWPDDTLPVNEIPIANARGIGIDGQGTPWIVADGKVFDGTTPFAASGSVPVDPRDVAFDPTTGTILVLDSDRVRRYLPDGTFVGAFGQGYLQDPVSLAVGDEGSVYISDAAESVVFRFAPP